MDQKQKRVRFTYWTDAERLKTLKVKAVELDINTSELIDRAVTSYLEDIEKHIADAKNDTV